ncbi:glycerophosphodiester phosphodiesterase family protein [Membranihabitans marinus]|uniref:glycerophosphodiester phosphodiesterase family protein n=1 Tax=Membranihabitans marinus TaxID=1227546 RepID=UPI001F190356|nr:glycerophosphodiester phosphodiesterase family protein [Membranihabitans marinus]
MRSFRLVNGLFLGLIAAFVLGCSTPKLAYNDFAQDEILVAAHRGYHVHVPENSIACIDEAIVNGIDIVEIDIRISADGIPVLMHDSKVDRTTNSKGELSSFTLAQLKAMRLLHKGQETEHTVPTLAEALTFGKNKVLFDLDIKTEQIEKIIKVIEETKTGNSVFFFDSDWEVLDKVYALHPEWKIMPRAYDDKMAKDAYERYKPWAVHVDPSFASPELADYLHDRNCHVWINALGDVDRDLAKKKYGSFEKLLLTKSNIIQTDWPVLVNELTEKVSN